MKNLNFSHKTKPFQHQVEGTNYIEKNNAVALFDEQGLGKSKMVIDALVNNIRDKKIDGAVIICKKTLLENWKDEIEIHSFLKPVVIDGGLNEKYRQFLNRSDFYIVCYESVGSVMELLQMLFETYDLAIVLDESQKIKNPDAKVTKNILGIAPISKKRIIITGTPIANSPEDLWSQYYFLDQGVLLGSDYEFFCSKYGIKYRSTSGVECEIQLESLKKIIFSNSLRRTKDVLSLPDKDYHEIKIEMIGKQKEMYEAVRKQILEELMLVIDNDDNVASLSTIDNQLVKLLRLIQISSNPKLIDSNFSEKNGKFEILDKLLTEITDKGEKCIIWSSFVSNVEELKHRYSHYNPVVVHGGLNIDLRNRNISKFKKDQSVKLMIANPAAAKEGLTLVAANNAIYLDRSFKMDDYLQSQDRIHRIGQDKSCHIIKLVCEDSIDEYIDEILRKKEKVLRYVVGDTDSIELGEELSLEYLIKILG